MPPRPQARRNLASSQNEHAYDLGKVGRKTGIILEDKGIRDEYGMEPADGLFSSPEKGTNGIVNGRNRNASDDEEAMEIDDDSPAGPNTVSRMRRDPRERLSIPRARSPMKTNLKSPAIRDPHAVSSGSSPIRGSAVRDGQVERARSVNRRLNFSADSHLQMKPLSNGDLKVNGSKLQNGKLTNVHGEQGDSDEEEIPRVRKPKPQQVEQEEEADEEEESMQVLDMGGDDDIEPPIQYEDDDSEPEDQGQEDEEIEQEEENTPVETVKQPKKRGRKPKGREGGSSTVEEEAPEPEEAEEEQTKKQLGRSVKGGPKKESSHAAASNPPKRRRSGGKNSQGEEENESLEQRDPKRQRSGKNATPGRSAGPEPKTTKGKPGRKQKSSGVGVDSPQVQRGPPMPKKRGLTIMRNQDRTETKITRSGRVSYQPLQFWKNERIEYDTEDEEYLDDKNGRRIKVGASIKEIVRYEEEQEANKPKRHPGRRPTGRSKRRASLEEEDEDRSDWEQEPGRVQGEVIYWYPEHEENPPDGEDQVEVIEEELAISESAVQMKDIKNATFRFAKTHTMPFFGAGIVDLPPHSEKRPKNSRKMQMVFFVHTGNVQVTVASTTFRIGKGGQWFVPRGNHYSIENISERPARIFFAQGCEQKPQESQEM